MKLYLVLVFVICSLFSIANCYSFIDSGKWTPNVYAVTHAYHRGSNFYPYSETYASDVDGHFTRIGNVVSCRATFVFKFRCDQQKIVIVGLPHEPNTTVSRENLVGLFSVSLGQEFTQYPLIFEKDMYNITAQKNTLCENRVNPPLMSVSFSYYLI